MPVAAARFEPAPLPAARFEPAPQPATAASPQQTASFIAAATGHPDPNFWSRSWSYTAPTYAAKVNKVSSTLALCLFMLHGRSTYANWAAGGTKLGGGTCDEKTPSQNI